MKKLRFETLAAFLAFFLSSLTFCTAAEITGPDSVEVGELATFSADVEGDWIVVPAKGVGVAKDSGKKALYLSATREGDFTIIFFSVENGQPVITQRAVTVGNPEPEPQPEPQPEPKPEPALNLTDAEKEAVSSAFQAVINGIEAGTIRTPQGARATFKSTLVQKTVNCANGQCSLSANVSKAISEWERSMDLTTLDGIREGFEKAKSGL